MALSASHSAAGLPFLLLLVGIRASDLPFDPSLLLQFTGWDAARVQMLDHMVNLMYGTDQAKRKMADQVLTQIKSHPDAWSVVETVLSTSQDPNTKFFALSLLESVISSRWLVLPEQQRLGMRNYVVQLVVKISSDEAVATTQKFFLTKLNAVLVSIVKQEWPHSWTDFISEICGSSKSDQSLCENNLAILSLLSEEVFNFGKDRMVAKKLAKLKDSMTSQFASIYELCNFIFKSHVSSPGSIKVSLLSATLSTLSHFLEWIPRAYIFETDLIETLLVHFWDPLDFRIDCVKCLNEIGSLKEGVQQYQPQLVRCFQGVVEKIQQNPEPTQACAGPQAAFWEIFHNQIALLSTGFLKNNMAAMEAQQNYMIPALNYLVRVSMVPNVETFKICVDFWQSFSAQLFWELQQQRQTAGQSLPSPVASPLMLESNMPAASDARVKQYSSIFEEVRRVIISKMAKPPEVTIKEDEEGHIVRAEEDTDELTLYKTMREALIYLTHLDAVNMHSIMVQRLNEECRIAMEKVTEKWSPASLMSLCWAIGSISGSTNEIAENQFLVSVIKDLLTLCERKKGKENKAVVASNIMYIVGQYPRFLRTHWKFLKTVVFKLFEFMHETFPGVQEMAVDTFLKICLKCKRKFVLVQPNEQLPFVEEMQSHLGEVISDLEHLHICTYFEAVGQMVSAAKPDSKERLVAQLMRLFNEKWAQLLTTLASNEALLQDHQTLRDVSLILRVNERIVGAVGAACHTQLANIYVAMLKIYKVCSDFISSSVAQQGAVVLGHSQLKLMRNVKRDVLTLVQTFVNGAAIVERAAEVGLIVQDIAARFIPPLLEPILQDYQANLPEARDAEVLGLLATLVTRLSDAMSQEITKIFEMVFECTLDMIKGDFQSYPDHRTKFYELLQALNSHCFQALFLLDGVKLKLYVDSMIWAMKHEQPQVQDSGLQILGQFVERLLASTPQVFVPFFKEYYFVLMQDVLSVLTDTLHKSGFTLQQQIFMQLISAVECGILAEVAPKQQVMEFLFDIIGKSFTTLHRSQVEIFVMGLFNKARQPTEFQQHIRDFLIQLREWQSSEDQVYEEERQAAKQEGAEGAKSEAIGLALRQDEDGDLEEGSPLVRVQVPDEITLKNAIEEFAVLQWSPQLSKLAGAEGTVEANDLADTSEDAICPVNFPALGLSGMRLPSRILRVLQGPLATAPQPVPAFGQAAPTGFGLSALAPRRNCAAYFIPGLVALASFMLAKGGFQKFHSFQIPERSLQGPLMHPSLGFDIA